MVKTSIDLLMNLYVGTTEATVSMQIHQKHSHQTALPNYQTTLAFHHWFQYLNLVPFPSCHHFCHCHVHQPTVVGQQCLGLHLLVGQCFGLHLLPLNLIDLLFHLVRCAEHNSRK